MANQQGAPQGKHRGIFEVYLPAVERCASCRRRYEPGERASSYAGVKVCVACAVKQEIGDVRDSFAELKTKFSELSYRVDV